MMPLSKGIIQMSTYVRDNQKQEWYDEPIYICCSEYATGHEIRDECRRRKIEHKCFANMTEYRPRRDLDEERCQSDRIYKIEIFDTGLKVKQLADWAITKFNYEAMDLPPYHVLAYNVWIQPQREVSVGSEGYDEDGDYLGYSQHWV